MLTLIGIVSFAVSLAGCSSSHQANQQAEDSLDAAIIDQLALYEQNPQFIEDVSKQLEGQGFTVDVYSGSEVTIDLYRNLPNYGYEIIIFRAHAGFLGEVSAIEETGPIYLFTGEEYTVTENTFGQIFDEINPAQAFDGYPKVFAINPKFVSESMKGNFRNTAIIMMGCSTARKADMAEAFVARGASVYIGWSASVCLDYVDEATENMIEELVVKRTSVELALSQTINKIGLDPEYNAHPQYYPLGVGGETIYGLLKD